MRCLFSRSLSLALLLVMLFTGALTSRALRSGETTISEASERTAECQEEVATACRRQPTSLARREERTRSAGTLANQCGSISQRGALAKSTGHRWMNGLLAPLRT